jgi:N-acetylneuraminate synthase
MFNDTHECFVIAEIGINHNGDKEVAHKLIDAAADAGCDAVKFQKRTPRLSLKPEQWEQVRDTPWGVRMTYIEYREKIEFGGDTYAELMQHAHRRDMAFGASAWDENACDTLSSVGIDFFKVASAKLTNIPLVTRMAKMNKPLIISTGMSEMHEVQRAVSEAKRNSTCREMGILACTAAYPAKIEDLNLRRIETLRREFPSFTIGWSGHEIGIWTSLMAVVYGARIVERHLTLDRAMKGSDHAASLEPKGMALLVREIRNWPKALGHGAIRTLDCEQADKARLR